jgi:Gas vesicle synthesis protein GvpO
MADLTDAQKKRQEARKKRRANQNDGAADENESHEQPLVNAAKVAAASAAVGAAAAAAKALTSRHAEGQEPDHEPQAEQGSEEQEQPEQEQPEQQEQEQPRAQAEEQEEEQREEPVEGAPVGDARNAAGKAREELEALLGKQVESVSSLERTHDGWVVALEVVELQRIPESTDVLASYELELDDDLNFRRYQQARRYVRSQANRGEE